jgi:integral membrane sensor domain MASE1
MNILQLKSKHRPERIRLLMVCAQFALVISIFLQYVASRWMPAWFPTDFISGVLIGFSLVGNLAFLVYFGKINRSQ